MDPLTMDQSPMVLTIFILALHWGYRLLYHNQDYMGRSMVGKLIVSSLLGILATTTASSMYHPWWLYFLRTSFMNYSLVLAYLAIDQLLNNKPYPPIVKHKLFLGVTTIMFVACIFDYLKRSYLDTIIAPSMTTSISVISSQPAWLFWISYILDYVVPWYLGVLVIILYWNNLHRYSDLTYIIRRLICMLGFLINLCSIGPFCLLMTGINLLSLFFFGRTDGNSAEQICLITRPLTFLLLLVGFTIPEIILTRAIRPLERYLAWRRQQQQELLAYLHEKMIRIVPGVQLPHNGLREIRTLIEISDARQIIWSQAPRARPITPKEEAEYLFYLMRKNTVLYAAGENLPPPTRYHNIIKHNLLFAKHLKRLSGNLA